MHHQNRNLITNSIRTLARLPPQPAQISTFARARLGSAPPASLRPRILRSTLLAAISSGQLFNPQPNSVRYSNTMSTPNPPPKQILVMVSQHVRPLVVRVSLADGLRVG